jgi:hypothetical protein
MPAIEASGWAEATAPRVPITVGRYACRCGGMWWSSEVVSVSAW